ncbi:MAG: lipocalin-like domain-containing protein [Dehalococcoidia bacterium]
MEPSVVGTWRPLSFDVRREDGQISYPGGKDQVGYLIYSDDGYFSVAMMRADRPVYSSDDFCGGTVEEKAAAAETYIKLRGIQSG